MGNPHTVYSRLTETFKPISSGLQKPELKTELDCILVDLATEIEAIPLFFERAAIGLKKEFAKQIAVERNRCAKAVCPGCSEDIPRKSENGREYHIDNGTMMRCAANGIFALDTGLIAKVVLPQLIPIDQSIKLKKTPETGKQYEP